MNYCIQCKDSVSGKVGDFLYCENAKLNTGVFKATSPVFDSLSEFFKWAKQNNITLSHY